MSRRQFALPQRGAERATRRHRLHGPARRHGRLLRLRVPAQPPRAGRHAGHHRRAATAAWCSRPPTRRAGSASPRRCRWRGPGGCARRRPCSPPDHRLYSQISAAVMATFDADHPGGRAALARRGLPRRLRARCAGWATPRSIGQLIRDTVHDEQGITCSVGVAPTKFVAKLASGLAKPDGMVVVPRDEVVSLRPAAAGRGPVGGGRQAPRRPCCASGLRTVADIAHTPLATLRRALGEAAGPHLHDLAWGRDPRRVEPERRERSIGSRRDLRARRRRPGIHPPAAAQAERPHRGAGACGRDASGARSRSGCGSPTSRRSPAARPCATPPTSAARSTTPPGPLRRPGAAAGPDPAGRGADGGARRGRRGAHPGHPRRARPRLARRRPRRRPGQCPVRCRKRATGQPDPDGDRGRVAPTAAGQA